MRRLQRAVHDELAALATLTETKIFECFENRDGEAVIDRRIFDIALGYTGFFKGTRSGEASAGVSQVELAIICMLHSFAMAK